MQSFKEFMEAAPGGVVHYAMDPTSGASPITAGGVGGLPAQGGDVAPSWERAPGKPWKAKRADVVEFWGRLKPNLPLQIEPIDPHHRGTRFHNDGLRITGSPEFINSILSRIKDFLGYESNPGTKLDVEYRQIETKEGDLYNKPVFVAYVHVLKKTGGKQDQWEDKLEKPKQIKLAKPI